MTRTRKQIESDYADRLIFALIGKLEHLAAKHKEESFDEAARRLAAARHLIRQHMHPDDVDATR